MAKLICLLVLAFAACMVAGLPQENANTMLHRTARAADPQPQFYGHGQYYPGFGGQYRSNIYSGHNYGHGGLHNYDLHCPHGDLSLCHYDRTH